METIIARGAQMLVALGGAYVVALWFVLVVWTFRDIETRSRSVVTQIFSTLLVVLFFVPGVLLYLILRPKEALDVAFQRSLEEEYLLQDLEELPLCGSCQRYVEDDFVICPHCQTQLRDACVHCSRLVDLRWTICPYCGSEQSRTTEVAAERVPEPAARWTSPSVLKRRILRPEPVVPVPVLAGADAGGDAEPLSANGSGEEVAVPAPVRLFDRRKTREAAQLNGGYRAVNGNGRAANGATSNGHDSMAERFARSGDGVRSFVVEPNDTMSDSGVDAGREQAMVGAGAKDRAGD